MTAVLAGHGLVKKYGATTALADDSTISTSGAIQLAVCVTLGALAMFAAIGASRPLLRRVTADPTRTAN
ncbi:hypothetical protein AB0D74_45605 [Streptomyces sp. NPDC048278]|uniref:hypothetical protein n=1 Tax=Streptomyces sp. NPDC048278 TaxID=3155809 RepID=UPI00343054B6